MKTRNRILLFFICLVIVSCESQKNEYKGYVYHGKMPLDSVLIKEDEEGSLNSAITNKDGHFKFKKSTKTYVPDLIFIKKGYRTDTVSLIRGFHSGSLYHLFLREESDTLQMNLE